MKVGVLAGGTDAGLFSREEGQDGICSCGFTSSDRSAHSNPSRCPCCGAMVLVKEVRDDSEVDPD